MFSRSLDMIYNLNFVLFQITRIACFFFLFLLNSTFMLFFSFPFFIGFSFFFISIFIAVIIIFIIVVIIIIIIIIIIIVTIIVILERLNWWKLTQMFHVISPTMESITARVEKSCKFSCLGIKTMWSLQLLLLLLLLLLLHYYFLYLWNFKCQVEFNPIQLQEKTDQKKLRIRVL